MAYILAQTQWPSTPVPNTVKGVIKNSFVCADDLNKTSRRELALTVLTPDCRLLVNGEHFPDREAILAHWDEVEDKFDAAKHEVLKVWSFDANGRDLLCMAKLTMILKGGQVVEAPFSMQFVIDGQDKIKYIETVIDYAPFVKMQLGLLKE